MEIDDLLMARVIALARQTYDLVIIDTFPMFDRVVIAALDLSDRVYVVLENVVPTLLGGVKLLEVLERIGYPADRQSVVVNRYQRIPGSLSMTDVAERLGKPIEHLLPYDKRVIAAANSGYPVAMNVFRFSGFSRALERLAADVVGPLAGQPGAERKVDQSQSFQSANRNRDRTVVKRAIDREVIPEPIGGAIHDA